MAVLAVAARDLRRLNQDGKTTVQLNNVPKTYTRQDVKDMLDDASFSGKYNFLYWPRDFKTKSGLGSVFVNMVTPELAQDVSEFFDGFSGWKVQSENVCQAVWATPYQGLQEHIDRYMNSPLMHPDVPAGFKPMLFEDGVEQPWPAPTRNSADRADSQ